MKLGYAQVDITPALTPPVFLAGFGQNRIATNMHDPLYARACAISNSERTIILCAVDLIGLFHDDIQLITADIKKHAPKAHIIIAATHTHHGPDTLGLWGPDNATRGVNQAYVNATRQAISRTILKALSRQKEISAIKSLTTSVPGLIKNARDPDILDEELTLVQFLSAGMEPVLTLFNYPCHPEVLWDQNPLITSDYPHFLRQTAEQLTGAPAIFFSGALGGMMTPDVQDHSFEEAEAFGRKLALDGFEALAACPASSNLHLGFKKKVFSVNLTNPLFLAAAEAQIIPDLRQRDGQIHTEANLLLIGDCWLLTAPGELLPKLGIECKKQMKSLGAKVTGIIGLANDELGYILPAEDFNYPDNPFEPGSHYEETMSVCGSAGVRFMSAADELLSAQANE